MKKFFLMTVLMLSVLFLGAQEQSGEFVGAVLLEDGSAVPGVTVTVKGTNLVGERTSVSDENGKYRFPLLPPGTYTIKFSLEGFKQVVRKGVVLEIGKTLKVDGVLQAGAIQEEVLVEGASPIVDVRKSSTATNLTKEVITKLPKGRDFTGVIATQAGVNFESGGGGDGFSFDGASSSENTFFVDGMNTTNTYSGVSGQRVDYDSVEEVQVKSSGYNAEYGGSMGGVVSVITKSGGNEFHGGLTVYYENRSLKSKPRKLLRYDPNDTAHNTAEYFQPYKDKGYGIEPGFNLGGYIIKDRLWFFTSLIPRFSKVTRPAYFEEEPEHNKEEFDQTWKYFKGSAKITAALTNNLRLSVSGSINNYKYEGSLPTQSGTSSYSSIVSSKESGTTRTNFTVAGGLDYSLGNNLFINVSGGFFRSNAYDSGTLPELSSFLYFYNPNKQFDIDENLKHGTGTVHGSVAGRSRNVRDISERLSLKGDLTYYFNAGGEHVAKVGFSWANVTMDRLQGNVRERWYFNWKNGDQNDTYELPDGTVIPLDYGYAFAYTYGENGKLDTDRWAFYLQDSWTIGNNFTLNFGVRFEKEEMPSMDKEQPQAAFKFGFFDKIAPRVGFAYDFNGDGKNKLFGSFGIYYDVMKLAMAVNSFGGGKMYYSYYNIADPDWTKYIDKTGWYWSGSKDPVNGGELLEIVNGREPSFDLIQPDMKPYSKMELSLGYQRELRDNLSFTARFLHNRILNAIEDIGVKIGSTENFFIGNPGSDWINKKFAEAGEAGTIPEGRKCPDPKREYYSLQLSLDKKFSDNWLGGVSVNFSSLKGNFSGLASTDEDNRQDPNVARYFDAWFLHYDSQMRSSDGVLPTDRPIDVKLYGAYTFDFGLTLGFNAYGRSGTPISTTIDLNSQDGYYPNGRGDQGRTPFIWQVDLYAEYEFELSNKIKMNFNVNITNLTNNKIARMKYNGIVNDKTTMTNEEIVAGYDLDEAIQKEGWSLNPLYLKEYRFMPPMEIRFGAKLSF